jgi:uncharacterized membrane protein YhaH (DUF805 family)
MNWYLKVLKQYADFSGRARRKEYWMFALFNAIFAIVSMILDNALGLTIAGLPYGAFYLLYVLAVLIPGLAVAVRRLHDVGKSGWMLLIGLIPIIGGIWLLVLMVTDSNTGDNEYGANPKTASDDQSVSIEYSGDTIITLVVSWMFFSRLFWKLIPMTNYNFSSEQWFKPINGLMTLIWGIIPIGLAFTVKDPAKRMVVFILGGIYLAYQLYEAVLGLMR